jgi:site-specific recombinase XerD
VTAIGLRPQDYGTHSLRRTKASLIYKQTVNLCAVQILLGHTKIETTVRYLGVDVEDALMLAEGLIEAPVTVKDTRTQPEVRA